MAGLPNRSFRDMNLPRTAATQEAAALQPRVVALDGLDIIPIEVETWWRGAVSIESTPPSGSDMTDTPEWSKALSNAFLPNGGAVLLVASYPGSGAVGVLPVYLKTGARRGPLGDRIATLAGLHGGRNTVLVDETKPDVPRAILRGLDARFPRWSCLELTLVDGNRRSMRFVEALGSLVLAIERVALEPSPYISLPSTFDDYFKTLKPSFRTEIRRGERRLKEIGSLSRALFTAPSDVGRLWDYVAQIERESWKQSAGTSITTSPAQERFYREMLPRAAAAGELLSTVLFLGERPIAHQICLLRDGTSSIHKMSYVEDLKRYYPSTVLLNWYLQDLVARGVAFLDFMGRCEEFKMRWTRHMYGRTKYLIYRNSMSGRLAYMWRKASGIRALARGKVAALERSPAGDSSTDC